MRVDQTRLRPDPTSTSTHGAEAAQPLLRLFRPHREHKAVSVRLLRPHRGRKAVSALSRCAVPHLECQICRSRFWIVKKKYRHCNLATPDPSPPTRPPAIANPMPPKPFCLQIDSQKRTRANDLVGTENGRGVVRRRRKGRGRGKGEREKERDR